MTRATRNFRIGAGLLLLLTLGILSSGQGAMLQEGSPYAYVPAISEGTIVAINLATNQLDWTLQVSQGTASRAPESAMGIAASPDGHYVYTGDAVAQELVVVDTEEREIVGRIALPHGVHAIDISPDGKFVWVGGGLADYSWLSATSVIDTATLEIRSTLSPALGSGSHLAFTPDGKEVWAASITTNLVWIWDATSGAVVDAIPLTQAPLRGQSPEAERGLIGFNEVAISSDGRRAYAVGPEAAIVYAIDVPTRQVIGTVQAGARAHGLAVSRDNREVWTADRGGTVTIIDASSLQVLTTLNMGEYANHVAFSRDGKYAYVTRQEDVVVIDTQTRERVTIIPVGRSPHEISLEDWLTSSSNVVGQAKLRVAYPPHVGWDKLRRGDPDGQDEEGLRSSRSDRLTGNWGRSLGQPGSGRDEGTSTVTYDRRQDRSRRVQV